MGVLVTASLLRSGRHLSFLADHNNAVVWIFLILPPISDSSSPLTNLLETVPSAPIIIGITVILMFHSSLARSKDLSLFLLSLFFTLWNGKIHYLACSDFNFLHNSLWITFPIQSCSDLYPFSFILLHLLTMWLIASSLSPYNLPLLFGCTLSILTLILLLFMVPFWAAFRRDWNSLLRFSFLSMSMFSLVRFCQFVAWNIHSLVFRPIFV